MKTLQVGKPFDFKFNENIIGRNGVAFEQFLYSGFGLIIFLSNMTKGEEIILRERKIIVKIIQETDYLVLPLLKFENSTMMFELVFDPLLYEDERKDYLTNSSKVNLIGIDSSTEQYITKVLRTMLMPYNLSQIWFKSWENAKNVQNFSNKFNRWIADLSKRYSVVELWEMARYIGEMED